MGTNANNMTAEAYAQWLVISMTKAEHQGPDFDELQEAYDVLMDRLQHLENCLAMDPYDQEK